MKKPFKKTLFGKLLIGTGDALTGGTVSNLVYEDSEKPSGQIDWERAGAAICTLILTASFALGKISISDVKELFLILNK